MTNTTNYNLKKPAETDFYDVADNNENMDIIDVELKNAENHKNAKNNPHGVTASQVGLGNVPNVSTNNQTVTYSAASDLQNLTSGEKLSVAFGKIKYAINSLINHLSNRSNPHSVTASQVGALSDNGGTLTGDVAINKNTPKIDLKNTQNNTTTFIQTGETAEFGVKFGGNNDKIVIAISREGFGGFPVLTIKNTVSGETVNYKLFGEHNRYDMPFLPKSGGTLTGYLTLSSDPTNSKHAATKRYVDSVRDIANNAQNTANAAMPKSGGTFTGVTLARTDKRLLVYGGELVNSSIRDNSGYSVSTQFLVFTRK